MYDVGVEYMYSLTKCGASLFYTAEREYTVVSIQYIHPICQKYVATLDRWPLLVSEQ